MEFLLELGQDPNAADDSGMTAIMVAILHLNLLTMRCVFRGGEAVRRNTVVDVRVWEATLLHQSRWMSNGRSFAQLVSRRAR